MHRNIIIRDIGPIKEVELEMNTINVFMGPQSSGKSTIAKLLSFCMWTDKEVTLHQDIGFINDEFIEKELFGFHKVRSYFNGTSYFKYESEILEMEYKDKSIKANIKPELANAILGKVAYIPAERIIVSLPGIQQTDLPYNSLRSFIFDWSKIRTKYNENNPVLIDDLNQKYYYDENSGRDMMVLESGKEIPFMESSSGIQSYVPLHISLKYLTEWIYNNQEDISYEKQDLIDSVVARFFLNEKEISGGDYTEQSFAIIKKQDHIQRIIKSLSKIDESDSSISNPKDEFESALSRAIDLRKRISKAHFSDIVIEEPELNLFPETQCSMIRVILEIVSRERDNFIITTHSPYILYALNNYMLGWLVKDTLAEENVEGFSSQKSFFVDPKKVSVWEIKDGTFWPLDNKVNGTIQDSDGLIRRNYFNKSMKSIMKDFNTFLGYYDKD